MTAEWLTTVPATEGIIKNLTLLTEQGRPSQSFLLMEKTHMHAHCLNGRNTGAAGAHQEGFLEEVTLNCRSLKGHNQIVLSERPLAAKKGL